MIIEKKCKDLYLRIGPMRELTTSGSVTGSKAKQELHIKSVKRLLQQRPILSSFMHDIYCKI